MISLLLLGLLLGVRHASDADHVAAVTAISSRSVSLAHASRVGVLWGLGHTTALLLFGGAIILFEIAVPPRLGLGLEFAVGVMLVTLGLRNVLPAPRVPQAARDPARPLVVGALHGLAGSGAVVLLVLAAIPDPRWAVAYLVLFGVGTMLGMVAVTTAIAVPSRLASVRAPRVGGALRFAAGAVSIAIGIAVMRETGIAGLFASP